jgi:hypothetical protein
MDDLTSRREPGTVAGAVPDFILIVPLHITAAMCADTAYRVELSLPIPVKRDVFMDQDDPSILRQALLR